MMKSQLAYEMCKCQYWIDVLTLGVGYFERVRSAYSYRSWQWKLYTDLIRKKNRLKREYELRLEAIQVQYDAQGKAEIKVM